MRNITLKDIRYLFWPRKKKTDRALFIYAAGLRFTKDDVVEETYKQIKEKLVMPIFVKDASDAVSARGWLEDDAVDTIHSINKLAAGALDTLYRSKPFMDDFVRLNGIDVQTDPFGGVQVNVGDISRREIIYSPLVDLAKKSKKKMDQKEKEIRGDVFVK